MILLIRPEAAEHLGLQIKMCSPLSSLPQYHRDPFFFFG
jgi:hypothetical protein